MKLILIDGVIIAGRYLIYLIYLCMYVCVYVCMHAYTITILFCILLG